MQLSPAQPSVQQTYQSSSFELAPIRPPVDPIETRNVPNSWTTGDQLDLRNLSNDLEIGHWSGHKDEGPMRAESRIVDDTSERVPLDNASAWLPRENRAWPV
jgi:hypothetical protein